MFLRAEGGTGEASAEPGSTAAAQFRPLRDMPRGWAATAFTAALGVALLAATEQPLLDAHVWALRTLLLLPPLAGVALSMVLLWPLRQRLGATGSHVRVAPIATAALLLVGWGAALWVTEFESSVSLRSLRGLALLGLFGGLATVVALGGGILASRSRWLERVGPIRLGAAVASVLAIASFALARDVDLAPFWPLRFANVFLEAALTLAAAALLRRARLVGRLTWIAGAIAVTSAALVAVTTAPARAHRAYARILLDGGGERRVLLRLRRLLDFDGDGFSALLDGGGCSERDPDAYPLGARDCDGILRQGAPPSPPPALEGVPQVSRVLVVTIDTWRCELRGESICPRMGELALSASYAGDQRPFMAQTLRSLGALFGAPYTPTSVDAESRPSWTLARAREAGYRSKAFYTLHMIETPSVAMSFDERDGELASQAGNESVLSGALTERVMADLAAHQGDAGRRLVWAHYLDPHATYVPTDEGAPVPFFLFDRRASYVAEVRRVEAHVADLVARARSLGYDRDAAILVTSDHGESFSHGRLYHSLSSFDTELKIPLFAWVFDRDGRLVHVPLPARTDERSVAALLARLLGAPPPPGQSALSVTDPMDGDMQYVLVDDGWKIVYHHQAHYEELYHLAVDPREEHELSESEPAQLARMRRLLGGELKPLFP
jgi:hypothetical protein